jgi:hypothetical protein
MIDRPANYPYLLLSMELHQISKNQNNCIFEFLVESTSTIPDARIAHQTKFSNVQQSDWPKLNRSNQFLDRHDLAQFLTRFPIRCLCRACLISQGEPPYRRRSTSNNFSITGGNGASNTMRSPVIGWSNPNCTACKAWPGRSRGSLRQRL